MASTFRRKGSKSKLLSSGSNTTDDPSSVSTPSSSPSSSLVHSLKGTKPWTGGITLTSTGLRDLDSILLGGQPLGTCILIEEDRWTRLAAGLSKYWCAEALAHQQTLLFPIEDSSSFVSSSLPFEDDRSDGDAETNQETHYWLSSSSSSSLQRRKDEIVDFLQSLPNNIQLSMNVTTAANPTAAADTPPPESSGLGTLQEGGEEEDHEENEKEGEEEAKEILDDANKKNNEDQQAEAGEEQQEEEDSNEAGLKIAWQYRKSVQQERMGYVPSSSKQQQKTTSTTTTKDVFCHSYDFRSVQANIDKSCIDIVSIPCNRRRKTSSKNKDGSSNATNQYCGFVYYQHLVEQLSQTIRKKESNSKLIRLFLFHPYLRLISIALPLLLTYIRTNGLRVVVWVAVQPWTIDQGTDDDDNCSRQKSSTSCDSAIALRTLRRTCDVVLQVQGFAARAEPPPPEFAALFQGLLTIPKLVCTNATSVVVGATATTTNTANNQGHFADCTNTKRPSATRFGLKRDRRKLHISMLHIPPEEFAHGGGSVGGGGVRAGAGRPKSRSSGGGMGCASSGGDGNSLLDF